MNILLTNDDGISAKGINILCETLSEIAKVTVVAPAFEQSATGHGITVNLPLRMMKAEVKRAASAWAVQGTPADCVKLGIEHILEDTPDLVISGINHGANLGTDTIYSGTVSGALEGYIYNIPSIAVSVVDGKSNMEYAAAFTAKVCRWWEENCFKPLLTLNINIPAVDVHEIQGYKICKLGLRTYENAFETRVDPRGRKYFWLHGSVVEKGDKGETDVEAIWDKYVSVTPLRADLTFFDAIPDLKNGMKIN